MNNIEISQLDMVNMFQFLIGTVLPDADYIEKQKAKGFNSL